jgi:hypothetical protein
VAHEGQRLPGVEPGHDLVDRLGHRESGHVGHRAGEGLGQGAGHVDGVAGPDHGEPHGDGGQLARLGLLAEERERTGRRRRSYRITADGRATLAAWLAEPTDEPLQVRSLGLLKLFFSQHAAPEDVAKLARVQAEFHRGGVEVTTGIIARLQARGNRPGQLAVAEIVNDAFQAMARQWERVERAAAEPPGPVAAARGR